MSNSTLRKQFFLVASFMLLASSVNASDLNEKVLSILKSNKINPANVSIYAVNGSSPVININKDHPLNPASCTKLVTTAVALKTLGQNYRFPTRFYLATGSRFATPDLLVKGFGDPSLVIERLQQIAVDLVKAGIPVSINDIIIDETYFADAGFPGQQKKSSRSYNAMTSAIALNHSAITVEVSPGMKPGAPALVTLDTPEFTVQNNAKTGARRSKKNIRISRVHSKNGIDILKISGHIPVGAGSTKQYFNITDPVAHFGNALKAILAERGVMISGTIKQGVIPAGAKLLLNAESLPLSEVIKDMNKHSNNFMAEQILKTVGAKTSGAPGTTSKGIAAIDGYMEKLGAKNFYFENGSGLSYKNEISAGELVKVMLDIYNDKSLAPAYVDSLSVFGVDGTMKKWNSANLHGRLKAKTGTLNGVTTLAGFLPEKNSTITFAILLNGGRINPWIGRKVEEEIVEALAGGSI